MADAMRISRVLDALHARYAALDEGALADYIPELTEVDPSLLAISIATTGRDGEARVHTAGDCDEAFTIQSVSKPFTYGRALELHGREPVLGRVGVEPTGDAFNSIIKLDAANRPHNPCVNAGAIAVTSMLARDDPTTSLKDLLDLFGRFAGRKLTIDAPVFTSERTHGHRNRAIAHLMRHFGMIAGDAGVDEVLDLYFQQCSIRVTCRDLAVMAATLANGGVNPQTGARAMETGYVRDVLTVMYTCGMYDYAGQWAYTVGLPAKSGISGAIIAVVPGRLGIAVYSPRVDRHGHSVRGLRVCEDLSAEFGMHLFDASMLEATAADDLFAPRDDEDEMPDASVIATPEGYTPDRGRAPEGGG
ncbi:MAG: glutaminase A [Planctomycetota bacterium]